MKRLNIGPAHASVARLTLFFFAQRHTCPVALLASSLAAQILNTQAVNDVPATCGLWEM
jgi:hypothetical protein